MWLEQGEAIRQPKSPTGCVLAGVIDQLQRQLDQYRADLTHIDGLLRRLASDLDSERNRPKRVYRRKENVHLSVGSNEIWGPCPASIPLGRLQKASTRYGLSRRSLRISSGCLRPALVTNSTARLSRRGCSSGKIFGSSSGSRVRHFR